ncbi:aminotransferase family protein (LolT) [Histoplasma ohiense]|nr:aminotransferase family protein (LolT) [Histoplasma ohiense (nom. inval.)]
MGSITTSDKLTDFGHPMLKHFLLDPNYKNLNHGSYGTFPAVVRDEARKFQDELEAKPDLFFRYLQAKYVDVARKELAKVLNAPMNEIVFIKNATTGVNIVLRNLQYVPGDVIVYFDTVYAACEKTIAWLMESTPVQARKVPYSFPTTHEEIMKRFGEVVKQLRSEGLNVRVALFDTIVSNPGVRFPFEELVAECRKEGILSCVDGAHGVGHIPLDLGKLDADFFVSNCHKWLYVPRGCAVFHVPIRNQHLIRTTLPTSHGFVPKNLDVSLPIPKQKGKSDFEFQFEFVATNDDSPYNCIPAALKFREEVCGGEERIMSYCQQLAHEGGNIVAEILGTDVMSEPGVDPKVIGASKIRQCAFANVRLPLAVDDGSGRHVEKDSQYPVIKGRDAMAVAKWILEKFLCEYDAAAPIFPHGGWLWTRLSGQTYLELEDFRWAGNALKELVERVGKGDAYAKLGITDVTDDLNAIRLDGTGK